MTLTTQQDFFNKIKDGAMKGWNTHKILPSISLAQAALESAWGKSELANKGNNLFGIKGAYNGDSVTIKTSEFVNGQWIKVDAKFRKYPSWNESVEDHGTFFTSSEWRKNNYKAVIGETDYKKVAKALRSAGYATDPTYADKLIKLIEEYKLNQWNNLKEEKTNMTEFLFIAGHGENKNGSFDPGATGIIKKGEHKYFEQDFFPAVKKFLPKDSNVILFSEYNVYDYKNLVTLANKYGKNTVVIEMHYDAGSSSASGGHVIVHSAYAPDKYDLAIRDVIQKHIGVRYNHKGHKGISGRSNLGNCNRAKSAGLNYRLVELGFGTNPKDAATMVNNVDAIAKDFVEALIGKSNDKPVVVNKPVAKPVATPVTPKPQPTGNATVKAIQKTVGVKEDGWDGPNTRKGVVKLFQRYFGANADGYVGNETLNKSKVIRSGDKGWHVYATQAMLYLKGYTSVGTPDQIAGPKFIQAVKNFQKDNGLGVDGTPGKQTYGKLLKL